MKKISVFLYFSFITIAGNSQEIVYSDISSKEIRSFLTFDIIGKVGKNYLVHKVNNSKNVLQVMDENMNLISYNNLSFLPDNIIGQTFIAYPSYVWLIHHSVKEKKIITESIKLDGFGNVISNKILLDSVYTPGIIYSENKQRILLYYLAKNVEGRSIIISKLFDADLNLLEKNTSVVKLDMTSESYDNFLLTNEGAFSFTITKNSGKDRMHVNSIDVILRKSNTAQYVRVPLSAEKFYFATPDMKVDNVNTTYLINAIFLPEADSDYKLGLFTSVINGNDYSINKRFNYFNNQLLAKNDTTNPAVVFKNFVLQKIVLKKDGSFIAVAENTINDSKYGWSNSMSQPLYSRFTKNLYPYTPVDNLTSSQIHRLDMQNVAGPKLSYLEPRKYINHTGNPAESYSFKGEVNEMLILDVSNTLDLTNSAVIAKKQKNGALNFISFGIVNNGPKLEFLYIDALKQKDIINSRTYTSSGLIKNNATLRTMEKGHKFMPRYIKQVAANEFLIPTNYRGRVAFARLVY